MSDQPQPIQVDAQLPVPITLKAEEWNAVLFVMGESPVAYRLTHPLIQQIGAGLQQAARAAAVPEVAPRPNGADLVRHIPNQGI